MYPTAISQAAAVARRPYADPLAAVATSDIGPRWFPGMAEVIERLPVIVNLVLYGGDDFALILAVSDPTGDPADLSGATARAQIRERPSRDAPVLAEFGTELDGGGLITLHLAAADAADLPERTVYDVRLNTGTSTALIAGDIQMFPQVTRDD
jgi:hypothetical protein